jgi:5-hydroxyisourate hydrolase
MSGRLTTQVIDAVRGVPAGGLLIDLFEWPPGGAERRHVKTVETNEEGGTDAALVAGDGMHPATFELLFHIGRYFKSRGLAPAGGLDLDVVPVRFAITDANAAYCISFVAGQRFFAVYSAEVPGA